MQRKALSTVSHARNPTMPILRHKTNKHKTAANPRIERARCQSALLIFLTVISTPSHTHTHTHSSILAKYKPPPPVSKHSLSSYQTLLDQGQLCANEAFQLWIGNVNLHTELHKSAHAPINKAPPLHFNSQCLPFGTRTAAASLTTVKHLCKNSIHSCFLKGAWYKTGCVQLYSWRSDETNANHTLCHGSLQISSLANKVRLHSVKLELN